MEESERSQEVNVQAPREIAGKRGTVSTLINYTLRFSGAPSLGQLVAVG